MADRHQLLASDAGGLVHREPRTEQPDRCREDQHGQRSVQRFVTRLVVGRTGLRGPITSVNGTKSVGVGGFYAHVGDPIRYDLRFNNSSEVGAASLDSAVAIDDLTGAGDFDLDSIDVGSWPAGVTADVATSPDGSAWTNIVGSPFSGVAQTVAIPDGSKFVRWTFYGPIPVGFSTSGIHLSGTMLTPASPPTTEVNCFNVSALRGASSYVETATAPTSCSRWPSQTRRSARPSPVCSRTTGSLRTRRRPWCPGTPSRTGCGSPTGETQQPTSPIPLSPTAWCARRSCATRSSRQARMEH